MNALKNYVTHCATRSVPKGTIIVLQDEAPVTGFALTKGIVKSCNITAGGSDKTLSFITSDSIFPLCWLFFKTKRALFYYQAHTDCELAVIDRKHFTAYLDTHAPLARYLLDHYVDMCVSDSLQLNALTQTTASAKLTAILRQLCLRHGIDVQPDRVRISVPLTQQEIANFIGVTRETTVIELNKLKRRNILQVSKKYYTVNTTRLNAVIDDDYNPGIVLA